MASALPMIVVCGASGQQGGHVARALARTGKFKVIGLSRNPQSEECRKMSHESGIEFVHGDLEDVASLEKAMTGAYGVFGVTTPYKSAEGTKAECRQGDALIQAAKKAGVKHFVFSSVGAADLKTGIPHFDSKFEIEKRLIASGIPYTIFRPVFFMENLLAFKIVTKGLVSGPLLPVKRPVQMIGVEDIAAFVTLAFQHPQQYIGKAMDIAGDELTGQQVAEVVSRVRKGEHFEFRGLPAETAKFSDDLYLMRKWFDDTGYSVDVRQCKTLYPGLMNLEQWSQKHLANRTLPEPQH